MALPVLLGELDANMLSFLNKYAKNFRHSQNGEEGILLECLRRLNITGGHAVEIGSNDGFFCSNTALLLEYGWSGKMVEADWNLYLKCKENWARKKDVRVQCCRVDAKNVNAFVDARCDVLSVDTDGFDYEIFEVLIARSKIVIVEIDSGIEPESMDRNSDGAAGYGLMVELGITKGYRLLCHTGNLVFIDAKYKQLFPETLGIHPLIETEKYFKRDWLQSRLSLKEAG